MLITWLDSGEILFENFSCENIVTKFCIDWMSDSHFIVQTSKFC